MCDFGSCVFGYVQVRNAEEKSAAEEIILKETTQIYRSPELVDLYMRDVLTEKSDIWVGNLSYPHFKLSGHCCYVAIHRVRFSLNRIYCQPILLMLQTVRKIFASSLS